MRNSKNFGVFSQRASRRSETRPTRAWTLPLSKLSKGNSGFWTRDAPGLCFDWGDAGNRVSVPIEGDWTRTSTGEWMWPRARLLAYPVTGARGLPHAESDEGPLRRALVVLGEDQGLGGGLPLARYGAAM